MNENNFAGLYLRLSKDDELQGESLSISTQRDMLTDYCAAHGHKVYKVYVDDGYSGLNFNRPGFQAMLEDIKKGLINIVITKDLSRLGRDYIMTGYYTEIYFPSVGVRYIALADDFDSSKGTNDIMPFKNILNDMYARDISKKVKNAKHQRAKQGLFIGSQAPYGYRIDPDRKGHLTIDPEAAKAIRLIYAMADKGLGSVAIASELERRKIETPAAYKVRHGDSRYKRHSPVKTGNIYHWCSETVSQILTNPVYTGQLTSLKTEIINYKTKKYIYTSETQQIITPHAHEAIIDSELFERTQEIRASHLCRAHFRRENLFRGKLFCECCGHPLAITKKKLKDRTVDIYICMHHFRHPDQCFSTHCVYHEMLYPYVLQQIQSFAKSMKRRKINSPAKDFANIEFLTPDVLDAIVERIEIGHITPKSRPGSVIHIYWKLK